MSESSSGPSAAPPAQWFERLLRGCTALSMLGVMVVISMDVAGRYFFAAPITGSYESVQVLLGLLFFSALPLTTLAGAHVSISMTDTLLRGRFRRAQSLAVSSLSAAIMGWLCVELWRLGQNLARSGRALGVLEIPLAQVAFAYSVLGGLTVVVYLMLIARALRQPRQDAANDDARRT